MPDHAARPARLATLAERVPTAPIAAAGLIAGFGVAQATGSRPLGGVVLAAFGLTCVAVWVRRDGRRTAAWLTAAGLLAFAISHLLGLVIGAWPSVIVVSAATAALYWWLSDARRPAPPSFSAPEPRAR
jgi:tetrahydromethanopterin S-methyltransferase subunit C